MNTDLDIIDFYPKLAGEIRRHENPIFKKDECLVIVREGVPGSNHAVVFHIVPNPIESVTSIAKFWRHDKAVQYCKFLRCKAVNMTINIPNDVTLEALGAFAREQGYWLKANLDGGFDFVDSPIGDNQAKADRFLNRVWADVKKVDYES